MLGPSKLLISIQTISGHFLLPFSISMAASTNLISFLFFTLLFSQQISARDSQFFSKANHFTSNNNDVKENEFPAKETPVSKPEQEPVFIPETERSYGLYGHETGQNPPSTTTTKYAPYTTPTTTTTTYQPYKTESEEEMNKYRYNDNNNKKNMYYSYHKDAYVYDNSNNNNQNEFENTKLTGSAYSSNNNNNYYNKDAYGTHHSQLSNKRYTEGEFSTWENQENNNNKYQKHYYNNNGAEINSRYNGERQGLSDTRFLENGKYFYDLTKEKYNPTSHNTYSNKGSVESRNWNNYFGNNKNNNGNFHENNNSMEEFQNQEDDQADFEP